MPGSALFYRRRGLSCNRFACSPCPEFYRAVSDNTFLYSLFFRRYNSVAGNNFASRKSLLLNSLSGWHTSGIIQQGKKTYQAAQQTVQLPTGFKDALLYSRSIYFQYHSRSGSGALLDRALEYHAKYKRRPAPFGRILDMDKIRNRGDLGDNCRSGFSTPSPDSCFVYGKRILYGYLSGRNCSWLPEQLYPLSYRDRSRQMYKLYEM